MCYRDNERLLAIVVDKLRDTGRCPACGRRLSDGAWSGTAPCAGCNLDIGEAIESAAEAIAHPSWEDD